MSKFGPLSDIGRVEAALKNIGELVEGTGHDPVKWGRCWRDAMKSVDVRQVAKSCRNLSFEGNDSEKRVASRAARVVNRGQRFVHYLDGVERDLANLYPADEAQRRLDEELGWDHGPNDDERTRLDRMMMRSRVRAPGMIELRRIAYHKLRGEFAELDVMNDAD